MGAKSIFLIIGVALFFGPIIAVYCYAISGFEVYSEGGFIIISGLLTFLGAGIIEGISKVDNE